MNASSAFAGTNPFAVNFCNRRPSTVSLRETWHLCRHRSVERRRENVPGKWPSITLERRARLAEHRPLNTLWLLLHGRDYIIETWGGLLDIDLRNGVDGQWSRPTISHLDSDEINDPFGRRRIGGSRVVARGYKMYRLIA